MKRALSGVKATGAITLGNYIGLIKFFVDQQAKYDQNFYFVPDLHSLNIRPKPADLHRDIYDTVALFLACGVDLSKSIIYLQSHISANSELFNILNNYVTMGKLSRMVQFKEKQQKYGREGLVAGFFEYPVLMAADIVLYSPDAVPLGDDQRQHAELAHDIIRTFNNAHGDTFKEFQPVFPEIGARVMDLKTPSKKMSKSDDDTSGCILMHDSEAVLRQKILAAVTDSGSEIRADKQNKPGMTNLLNIYAALAGVTIAQLEDQYADKSYSQFKEALADVVVGTLLPIQHEYQRYVQDKAGIKQILKAGKATAEPIAQKKLTEVKDKIGLVSP